MERFHVIPPFPSVHFQLVFMQVSAIRRLLRLPMSYCGDSPHFYPHCPQFHPQFFRLIFTPNSRQNRPQRVAGKRRRNPQTKANKSHDAARVPRLGHLGRLRQPQRFRGDNPGTTHPWIQRCLKGVRRRMVCNRRPVNARGIKVGRLRTFLHPRQRDSVNQATRRTDTRYANPSASRLDSPDHLRSSFGFDE